MNCAKLMVLGAVVLGLTMAGGRAEERLAVVKLEALLKAHPETAPAEAILEKQRDEYEEERRDMLAQRDRLRSAFEIAREEAENPALSEEARLEKLKGLETRYKAVRDYEREIQETQGQRQKELSDQGRRLRERIVVSIRDVLSTYAREQGFTLVLNAEDAGMGAFGSVLYHEPKIDITEAVKALVAKQPVAP